MTQVAKLSVALTPEMAAMVERAVESGDYATSSEVIREALREWKQRRMSLLHDPDRLKALWDEGVASGPGRLADMAEIKAEARRRLAGALPQRR